MKNVANFLLFQAFWFAAVLGAAQGRMWVGPVAVLVFLVVHLRMVPADGGRARELLYVVGIGLVGTLLDSLLGALGATSYPTSEVAWPFAIVPPWITALWMGFAMLPRFSLGWLAGRPVLAFALGAIGGPLSYLAGTRLEAVGVGEFPLLTWGALALEYAIAMPVLLRFSASHRPGAVPSREARKTTQAVSS